MKFLKCNFLGIAPQEWFFIWNNYKLMRQVICSHTPGMYNGKTEIDNHNRLPFKKREWEVI